MTPAVAEVVEMEGAGAAQEEKAEVERAEAKAVEEKVEEANSALKRAEAWKVAVGRAEEEREVEEATVAAVMAETGTAVVETWRRGNVTTWRRDEAAQAAGEAKEERAEV